MTARIKETGFCPISSHLRKYLAKNPVSRHHKLWYNKSQCHSLPPGDRGWKQCPSWSTINERATDLPQGWGARDFTG